MNQHHVSHRRVDGEAGAEVSDLVNVATLQLQAYSLLSQTLRNHTDTHIYYIYARKQENIHMPAQTFPNI